MRRFRRLLAAVSVLALLVSMPGLATAAFPDVSGTRFADSANYLQSLGVVVGDTDGNYWPIRNITRAEATKIIVNIIGRGDQVAPLMGTAAFPDTVAHWASGYIALAKNLGIVDGFPDGTFKPNDEVTYVQMAKMLLVAVGIGPDTTQDWPKNYMNVAEARGLFTGIPSYLADIPAIRGDCGMMTAHLVRYVANPLTGKTLAQSIFGAVASLELTPTMPSTPVGAAVQFTAVPKNAAGAPVSGLPIAFTTSDRDKSTVSQTGMFNSALMGTYTVTATTAGISANATVSVFGPSLKLRATPSTTQVSATGASIVTITVEVVDAVGNRVSNNNTAAVTMAYAAGGSNGAVVLGPATQTVTAGVAVFEVTSTTNGARTDTLEFTSPLLTKASVAISTVDQVPTSIAVTADPLMIRANSVTQSVVRATVLDQSGAQMTSGVVSLTFSIRGPGTFAGGSTEAQTHVTGTGSAEQEVYSIQAVEGTIVVSVTAEGLTSGEVSIVSYTAGSPVGIAIDVSDGTITAGQTGSAADVAQLQVTLVDAGGRPSTRSANTVLDIMFANGAALSTKGLALTGSTTIPAGQSATGVLKIGAIDGASGVAGVYDLKVVVVGGALPEDTFEVSVVPGAPASLAVLPNGNVKMPVANPQANVYVQLVDAAGNNVAVSGVNIAIGWQDVGGPNSGLPRINGTLNPPTSSSSPYAVKSQTDSSGVAVFTFAPHGYVGDDYQLSFLTGALSADSGVFAILNQVASQVTTRFFSPGGSTISQVKADWSQFAGFEVTVLDGAGNAFGGWDVEIAFPEAGINVDNVSVELGTVIQPYADGKVTVRTFDNPGDPLHGKVSLLFQGKKAGSFVVSAKAVGLAVPVTVNAPFRVAEGTTAAGVKVTTATGGATTSLSLEADTVIALKLVPVDYGGNQITSPVDIAVLVDHVAGLYSTYASGEFRLQPAGAQVIDGSTILIGRGTNSKSLYYVQGVTQSGVTIGIDANDTAYTAYQINLETSTAVAGPPAGYQLTYKVTDASGNAVPGVAVQFDQSIGALSATGGTTNSNGLVTVSWTGGAGGQITATVTNAVLGGGVNRVSTLDPWPAP